MRGDDVSEKTAPVPAAPVPEQDENFGVGGSYVLDPVTGKRQLVQRTREADASDTQED